MAVPRDFEHSCLSAGATGCSATDARRLAAVTDRLMALQVTDCVHGMVHAMVHYMVHYTVHCMVHYIVHYMVRY